MKAILITILGLFFIGTAPAQAPEKVLIELEQEDIFGNPPKKLVGFCGGYGSEAIRGNLRELLKYRKKIHKIFKAHDADAEESNKTLEKINKLIKKEKSHPKPFISAYNSCGKEISRLRDKANHYRSFFNKAEESQLLSYELLLRSFITGRLSLYALNSQISILKRYLNSTKDDLMLFFGYQHKKRAKACLEKLIALRRRDVF